MHHSGSQQPQARSQKAQDFSIDWVVLLAKVKNGDPAGREEYHRRFSRGIHFQLGHRLGLAHPATKVRETCTILVSAIKAEDLHEHEPLLKLVRSIARESPGVIDARENIAHMVAWLGRVSRCFQEALIRFYLGEQTQEGICKDMQLTAAQFALLKKRTKTNFCATRTVGESISTHDWDETVEQYSMGKLQGNELETFEAHLHQCTECQGGVGEMASFLEAMRGATEHLRAFGSELSIVQKKQAYAAEEVTEI